MPKHSLPPQEQIFTYWGRFINCPYGTPEKPSLLFLTDCKPKGRGMHDNSCVPLPFGCMPLRIGAVLYRCAIPGSFLTAVPAPLTRQLRLRVYKNPAVIRSRSRGKSGTGFHQICAASQARSNTTSSRSRQPSKPRRSSSNACMSGNRSASGTRTNARSCRRGCGSVSSSSPDTSPS